MEVKSKIPRTIHRSKYFIWQKMQDQVEKYCSCFYLSQNTLKKHFNFPVEIKCYSLNTEKFLKDMLHQTQKNKLVSFKKMQRLLSLREVASFYRKHVSVQTVLTVFELAFRHFRLQQCHKGLSNLTNMLTIIYHCF